MTKILNLLKKLITEFDPYGYEHGERVAVGSMYLASLSGIHADSQLMKDIQTAAYIHDVGKVGVPESVRRQLGKYTAAERKAMQGHVTYGVELLELVTNGTINDDVLQMVKYHHKDFCGTGYPEDDVKGDRIPLGARIIRIMDSYDAMTHERGYRPAMTDVKCVQELIDDQIKFILFDPDLFRLFIKWKSGK